MKLEGDDVGKTTRISTRDVGGDSALPAIAEKEKGNGTSYSLN